MKIIYGSYYAHYTIKKIWFALQIKQYNSLLENEFITIK